MDRPVPSGSSAVNRRPNSTFPGRPLRRSGESGVVRCPKSLRLRGGHDVCHVGTRPPRRDAVREWIVGYRVWRTRWPVHSRPRSGSIRLLESRRAPARHDRRRSRPTPERSAMRISAFSPILAGTLWSHNRRRNVRRHSRSVAQLGQRIRAPAEHDATAALDATLVRGTGDDRREGEVRRHLDQACVFVVAVHGAA